LSKTKFDKVSDAKIPKHENTPTKGDFYFL